MPEQQWNALWSIILTLTLKMHLTQQLYDEDKDLHVEMAEMLLPIVTDSNNDGLIFFWTKQHFIFLK